MEKWIRFNTTLGVMVPILIGSIVLTYGTGNLTIIAIWIAGPLGLFQVVLSVLSLTYNWEERRSSYLESTLGNRKLFEGYTLLTEKNGDITGEYIELLNLDSQQNNQDDKYPFDDHETRIAHRAGLRQVRLKCLECDEIPVSMESTQCNLCGKYKFNLLKLKYE